MTIKTAIENKITALFMGRTDKLTRLWFPVQKMTWSKNNGEYSNCITVFTHGAKQEGIIPKTWIETQRFGKVLFKEAASKRKME